MAAPRKADSLGQGGRPGESQKGGCGLVWGRLLLAIAWPTKGTVKEADLKETVPEKAQRGLQPTSTLLWIFSLSGHLVLSQDSSFRTWDFPEGPQLLPYICLTRNVLNLGC